MTKRIIAVFTIFVIIFLMVPVASADYTNSAVGWWQSLLHGAVKFGGDIPLVGSLVQCSFGELGSSVCSQSSDGFHHTPSLQGCSTGEDENGLYANATCQYCNKSFKAYSKELQRTYEEKVKELPAKGYASDGGLLYRPSITYVRVDDMTPCSTTGGNHGHVLFAGDTSGLDLSDPMYHMADGTFGVSSSEAPKEVTYQPATVDRQKVQIGIYSVNTAPIAGSYEIVEEGARWGSYISTSLGTQYLSAVRIGEATGTLRTYVKGDELRDVGGYKPYSSSSNVSSITFCYRNPLYRVTPSAVDGAPDYTTIYDQSTRMGNVSFDYGVTNSDNSVTNVTNNYIVNETTNTYTNPVTGTEKPISSWSYDYGDRSYAVTLEGGDTTTVTYGDENVTINENTVNENGDTITNNYTIYYVVNNTTTDPTPSVSPSGSPSTDPTPSPSSSAAPSASPSTDPTPSASPSPSAAPGGGSGSGGDPGGSGSTNSLSRVFANYAAKVTQAFGHEGHHGTDCIPTSGVADTITAHSEGDVVWVQTGQVNDTNSEGALKYGNAVKIKHANGYYTLYAHLDTVDVANGDHVYKGQSLGMMGNTGNSYGAHLHFEVRDENDTCIDSGPYLNADLPGLAGGGASSADRPWWEKLGDLLGIGVSGLLDILGAAINKVLDGLISLLEGLISRLTTVVETVLSVFDVIPGLFGGFLDLLGLLFPFLPTEMVTILTFGIIAVVAIWIIKAIIGR